MENKAGGRNVQVSSGVLIERVRKKGHRWIDVVHSGLTVTDLDFTILNTEGWGWRLGDWTARVYFSCCGKEENQKLQTVVQRVRDGRGKCRQCAEQCARDKRHIAVHAVNNNLVGLGGRASSGVLIEQVRKNGLRWVDVVHAGLTVTDLDFTILHTEGWGGRPGNWTARVCFGCCGNEADQKLASVVQRVLDGRGKCRQCAEQCARDNRRKATSREATIREGSGRDATWAHKILNAARAAGQAAGA